MIMNKIQIPLDVLAYWYEAAKEGVMRYEQGICFHPSNPELSKKRQRAYEMAIKTIKCLENVVENIEITEIKKENEQ